MLKIYPDLDGGPVDICDCETVSSDAGFNLEIDFTRPQPAKPEVFLMGARIFILRLSRRIDRGD